MAPQHAGCTGKVENCVTTVFSAYVTAGGQAWADLDLYLPERKRNHVLLRYLQAILHRSGCLHHPATTAAEYPDSITRQSAARRGDRERHVSEIIARVDRMMKRTPGAAYVFTVDPEAGATSATLMVPGVISRTVQVVGEYRTLLR